MAMKNRNGFYICSVLRNEAIKPSKLKLHLQQKHQESVEKNLDFSKTKTLVETAKIRRQWTFSRTDHCKPDGVF